MGFGVLCSVLFVSEMSKALNLRSRIVFWFAPAVSEIRFSLLFSSTGGCVGDGEGVRTSFIGRFI